MPTLHSLPVSRTAHYYMLGTPGRHIRHYWLVCHGYAQLADELLASFSEVEDNQTLIVAPEALNYFYKKGFGGAPGATWMTKQHRVAQIADYTAYLTQLHLQILSQLPDDVKITILGFSQGVSTIYRWIVRSLPQAHHIVLWAGSLPEDEPLGAISDYWKDKKIYYYYGDKDPFINADSLPGIEKIRSDHHLTWEMHRFEGVHEVPKQEALRLKERIEGVV